MDLGKRGVEEGVEGEETMSRMYFMREEFILKKLRKNILS